MNSKNQSGRQMNEYAPSKSDPICKWRAVSVANAMELVKWLPKETMSKDSFREYMANNLEGDFFHTPYQLACQMGLYYEDEENFYPRFDHDIEENEALAYLTKWMSRYYVPNPYTKRGFVNVPPMHLVNALLEYMEIHPNKPNLATAGAALFGGEVGNISSVKSMLNSFANELSIDKDYNITVLADHYSDVEVHADRNDKKAFFEHFN